MFDPKTATYKIEKTKYKGGKWINANTPVNTEGEPPIGTLQLGQDGQFWIFAEQDKKQVKEMKTGNAKKKADEFYNGKARIYKKGTEDKEKKLAGVPVGFNTYADWEYLAKVWQGKDVAYLGKIKQREINNPWAKGTLNEKGKRMLKSKRKIRVTRQTPFLNSYQFNANKKFNPKTYKSYPGYKGEQVDWKTANVGVGYEEEENKYTGKKWVKGGGFNKGQNWSKIMRYIFLTHVPYGYDMGEAYPEHSGSYDTRVTGLGHDSKGKDLMPLGIKLDEGNRSYYRTKLRKLKTHGKLPANWRDTKHPKYNPRRSKSWKPRVDANGVPEANPNDYRGNRKRDMELLLEARDILEERQRFLDKAAKKADKAKVKKKGTWVRIYASGGKGYTLPKEKTEVLLPPFIYYMKKGAEDELWNGNPFGKVGRKQIERKTLKDSLESDIGRKAMKVGSWFGASQLGAEATYEPDDVFDNGFPAEVKYLFNMEKKNPNFYTDNVEEKTIKIEDLPKTFRDEWYTTKPQEDSAYRISYLDKDKNGKYINPEKAKEGGKEYWGFNALVKASKEDKKLYYQYKQRYKLLDPADNNTYVTDEPSIKGVISKDEDGNPEVNPEYRVPIHKAQSRYSSDKFQGDFKAKVFRYKDKLPAELQWHLTQEDRDVGSRGVRIARPRGGIDTQRGRITPCVLDSYYGTEEEDGWLNLYSNVDAATGIPYHPDAEGNPIKINGKILEAVQPDHDGERLAIKKDKKGNLVGDKEPGKWYCHHTGLELEEVKEKPDVYWLRRDKFGPSHLTLGANEWRDGLDTSNDKREHEQIQAWISRRNNSRLADLHPSGPQTHFQGYSIKMTVPEKTWETKRTEKKWEKQLEAADTFERIKDIQRYMDEKDKPKRYIKEMTEAERALSQTSPTKKGDVIDVEWMKRKAENLYVAERSGDLRRPDFNRASSSRKNWVKDSEKKRRGEEITVDLPIVDWSQTKAFQEPPSSKAGKNLELREGVGSGYIKKEKGIFAPDALEMQSKKKFGYRKVDEKMIGKIDSFRTERVMPTVNNNTWQLLYARKTANTPPIKIWLSFETSEEQPWKRGKDFVKEEDLPYRTDSLGQGAFPVVDQYRSIGKADNVRTRKQRQIAELYGGKDSSSRSWEASTSKRMPHMDREAGEKRYAWSKGVKSPAGSLLENIINSKDKKTGEERKMHIYKVDINNVILDSGGYETVKTRNVANYIRKKKKKLDQRVNRRLSKSTRQKTKQPTKVRKDKASKAAEVRLF